MESVPRLEPIMVFIIGLEAAHLSYFDLPLIKAYLDVTVFEHILRYYVLIPVVPHKAVAEFSKIGNL